MTTAKTKAPLSSASAKTLTNMWCFLVVISLIVVSSDADSGSFIDDHHRHCSHRHPRAHEPVLRYSHSAALGVVRGIRKWNVRPHAALPLMPLLQLYRRTIAAIAVRYSVAAPGKEERDPHGIVGRRDGLDAFWPLFSSFPYFFSLLFLRLRLLSPVLPRNLPLRHRTDERQVAQRHIDMLICLALHFIFGCISITRPNDGSFSFDNVSLMSTFSGYSHCIRLQNEGFYRRVAYTCECTRSFVPVRHMGAIANTRYISSCSFEGFTNVYTSASRTNVYVFRFFSRGSYVASLGLPAALNYAAPYTYDYTPVAAHELQHEHTESADRRAIGPIAGQIRSVLRLSRIRATPLFVSRLLLYTIYSNKLLRPLARPSCSEAQRGARYTQLGISQQASVLKNEKLKRCSARPSSSSLFSSPTTKKVKATLFSRTGSHYTSSRVRSPVYVLAARVFDVGAMSKEKCNTRPFSTEKDCRVRVIESYTVARALREIRLFWPGLAARPRTSRLMVSSSVAPVFSINIDLAEVNKGHRVFRNSYGNLGRKSNPFLSKIETTKTSSSVFSHRTVRVFSRIGSFKESKCTSTGVFSLKVHFAFTLHAQLCVYLMCIFTCGWALLVRVRLYPLLWQYIRQSFAFESTFDHSFVNDMRICIRTRNEKARERSTLIRLCNVKYRRLGCCQKYSNAKKKIHVVHGVHVEPAHIVKKRSINQQLRILLHYDDSVYRLMNLTCSCGSSYKLCPRSCDENRPTPRKESRMVRSATAFTQLKLNVPIRFHCS
ncbi:unnamed protein product, partial [Trichogramma brassicae]